ncbi:hypothetical protein Taro_024883 [Colocasia esculenta]|uniref:Uncharacterized protein n=1 Tax=Colocasia esculenta TaxID=4460 RepID=A0A843V7F7_COLES|nr:hypothetical protein [Colocasia esculenta]
MVTPSLLSSPSLLLGGGGGMGWNEGGGGGIYRQKRRYGLMSMIELHWVEETELWEGLHSLSRIKCLYASSSRDRLRSFCISSSRDRIKSFYASCTSSSNDRSFCVSSSRDRGPSASVPPVLVVSVSTVPQAEDVEVIDETHKKKGTDQYISVRSQEVESEHDQSVIWCLKFRLIGKQSIQNAYTPKGVGVQGVAANMALACRDVDANQRPGSWRPVKEKYNEVKSNRVQLLLALAVAPLNVLLRNGGDNPSSPASTSLRFEAFNLSRQKFLEGFSLNHPSKPPKPFLLDSMASSTVSGSVGGYGAAFLTAEEQARFASVKAKLCGHKPIIVPRSATFSSCTKADSDLMYWAIQNQEINTAELIIERMNVVGDVSEMMGQAIRSRNLRKSGFSVVNGVWSKTGAVEGETILGEAQDDLEPVAEAAAVSKAAAAVDPEIVQIVPSVSKEVPAEAVPTVAEEASSRRIENIPP